MSEKVIKLSHVDIEKLRAGISNENLNFCSVQTTKLTHEGLDELYGILYDHFVLTHGVDIKHLPIIKLFEDMFDLSHQLLNEVEVGDDDQSKKRPFGLITDHGLDVGSYIYFKENPIIRAKVVDDRHVLFCDKMYKLTPLTKQLKAEKFDCGQYCGPQFWCAEGNDKTIQQRGIENGLYKVAA